MTAGLLIIAAAAIMLAIDVAMARSESMDQDIHVIAVVRGVERYVLMYRDETRDEALRQLGRWAANEELSFTWYDAAVCSQKIRQKEMQDAGPLPKEERDDRNRLGRCADDY